MKVIKHGLSDKEAIHMICPWCKCEFDVDDRKDWTIGKVFVQAYQELSTHTELPTYSINCPECNYEFWLGIDPNDLDKKGDNFHENLLMRAISQREDWIERYKVLQSWDKK